MKKFKRKFNYYFFPLIFFLVLFTSKKLAFALEPGAILYRSSSDGQMYGYNNRDLIIEKNGIIRNVYSGHAAIYIGKEDGVDYVVEALGNGVVKTPAKYFINEREGEELIGVKLPKEANIWQRAKAVAIAKFLAKADLAYDFDFSSQKGPASGDWTCVGLVEKIYESSNANNPEKLASLEYNPNYYAVNITPDGYDDDSFINDKGDVFSRRREFSKIARRKITIFPPPEIIGYNAGKEYGSNRYIFLPYTQAVQSSLMDTPLDISISSDFPSEMLRGKDRNLALILRWTLINNPKSSIKRIVAGISNGLKSIFNSKDEARLALGDEYSEDLWDLGNLGTDYSLEPLEVEYNPELYDNPGALANGNSSSNNSFASLDNDDVFSSLDPNKQKTNPEPKDNSPIASSSGSSNTGSSGLASSQNERENNSSNTSNNNSNNSLNNNDLWMPILNNNPNNETQDLDNKQNDSQGLGTGKISLVISRLHSNLKDDWIELWNYGTQDIDLAQAEIRLEKSVTAIDPGIIMRIGHAGDGIYPKGTIIKAGSYYRIVRSEAREELKAAAHAIALRSDFNFADTGAAIYLANGPVSSPDDEDIIDLLGYGRSAYFEGSGPAPALEEGYMLRRKASASTKLEDILKGGREEQAPAIFDSNNNVFDFLLWPLGGVLIEKNKEEEKEDEKEEEKEGEKEDKVEDDKEDEKEDKVEDDKEDEKENEVENDKGDEVGDDKEDDKEGDREDKEGDKEEDREVEDEEEEEELDLTLVIGRIYAEAKDDWIELWNYGTEDLDLAALGVRLEKSVTAYSPSIIIRFGNLDDASYPGGTIIRAGSYYRIVRAEAREELRAGAQAIANRSEFSFSNSGASVYLAKGPVSSPDDEDIIDLLGYGDVNSYEGSAPAPALAENYLLRRKARSDTSLEDILLGGSHENLAPIYDSDNNYFDFLLWPLGGSILEEDPEDPDEGFSGIYRGINSPGLSYLWSFPECEGETSREILSKDESIFFPHESSWAVGKFTCAQSLTVHASNGPEFLLKDPLSETDFSLVFYYKFGGDYGHFEFTLSNKENEDKLVLGPSAGSFDFSGFPGLSGRHYEKGIISDGNWHQLALVWNGSAGYWAIYSDGEELFSKNFSGLAPNYDSLKFNKISGEFYLDEVALWNRALSKLELESYFNLAEPFNPQVSRDTMPDLALLHFWDFNEAGGTIAKDKVANLEWTVPEGSLVYSGIEGRSLLSAPSKVSYLFPVPNISTQNYSLSWWYSIAREMNDGMGRIILSALKDEYPLFTFKQDYLKFVLSSPNMWDHDHGLKHLLKKDDTWHHFALVYDDYRYRMSIYIDGNLELELERLPPLQDYFNTLEITSNYPYFKLDNFKIWRGLLSPEDVLDEYLMEKPD